MSHPEYWQTVGQQEEYDQLESEAEAAANRQMQADQSDQDFIERMKTKWPGVLLWPGRKDPQ